ncbi:MAG: potassium-transporting ATPase subunit KdpC [Gemmataceae bacterium]
MKTQLRSTLVLFGLLTLLTGVVYPLVVTLVAQVFFSHQANGSILVQDGHDAGSALIGQPFSSERYFWGRPSSTVPVPYNAASSAGSNLGPTNPALLQLARSRIARLQHAHPDQEGPAPVDLVTASASGLDPHISPAAAEYQVTRVARVRGRPVAEIRHLVEAHTEGRTFSVLGERRVNVLQLNLELDRPEAIP